MSPNPFRGKRATVMGLGLFGGGVAVTRYLVRRRVEVTVTDLRPSGVLQESIDALRGLPVRFHLAQHHEEDFLRADFIVANPAVRADSPYLQLARSHGIPITSEIDLFLDACPARSVAVTGSNGKSTTTALLGAILSRSSLFRKVWVGGNIGHSLLDQVEEIQSQDLVVLELSSFQLEVLSPRENWPEVAVVTRLAEDHLDRHGNFQSYAKAKARILAFQGPENIAVLNADDPVSGQWGKHCRGKTLYYGIKAPDFWISDRSIFYKAGQSAAQLIPRSEIRLLGEFNLENVMAASAAAFALGAQTEVVREAISQFPGLEHRLEYLGEKEGVRIYNNAVSTTPESTISAIRALRLPVVLVAGGKEKKLSLDPLVKEILKSVRTGILYGSAAPTLARAVVQAGGKDLPLVGTLSEALDFIFQKVRPGDTLLFSPAFSSYDHYRNFRERGEEFRGRVEAWFGKKKDLSTAWNSPKSFI